ncbi:DUF4937 domain-containing protein [Paenibacillus tarimensis]
MITAKEGDVMLIKMIKCKVNHDMQSLFLNAQSKWTELTSVPGFVVQFGGWNQANPEEAYIFGVWNSLDSYTFFMNAAHDRILNRINQKGSYESIEVSLWNPSEKISSKDLDEIEYIELLHTNVNNNIKCKDFLLTSLKDNEEKWMKLRNQVITISNNRTASHIKLVKDWTVIGSFWGSVQGDT